MIYRITNKLAKKLHLKDLPDAAADSAPLADWTANLIVANRHQYILITNGVTLYSIVIRGAGITDGESFHEAVMARLNEDLTANGMSYFLDKQLQPHVNNVEFAKTSGRRVLGSMTDFKHTVNACMAGGMEALLDINRELNTTPMRPLDYQYPRSELYRLILHNAGGADTIRQELQRPVSEITFGSPEWNFFNEKNQLVLTDMLESGMDPDYKEWFTHTFRVYVEDSCPRLCALLLAMGYVVTEGGLHAGNEEGEFWLVECTRLRDLRVPVVMHDTIELANTGLQWDAMYCGWRVEEKRIVP